MDFPRPIMSNVVYVGGLGIKNTSSDPKSSIPDPFPTEMTKGDKGVVFVSFGSNVNSADLPDVVRRNLIDGLAAIHEYHVILKLEKEDTDGIAYAKTKRNIFVTPWAPQAQLLQHPRLKLFFTHGGYNSLLEVAQSGKPVLLIPFLYDQTRNAMLVQRNGWGHVFDKISLTKGWKQLENDLRMVLEDPRFAQGAERIQNLLATKPFSADEIFLRNVQFVLDNNGTLPELQSASARLSFIQQFNLDIIILFGLLVLIVLFCISAFAKIWRVVYKCRFKTSEQMLVLFRGREAETAKYFSLLSLRTAGSAGSIEPSRTLPTRKQGQCFPEHSRKHMAFAGLHVRMPIKGPKDDSKPFRIKSDLTYYCELYSIPLFL
ncbi:UDP-glucoronosyl and UDP-glucosyl transferase domain-containing protein [Ditylenchus destructor]|nr:UDP-glucoronosyl and UDP-glucosyl transferase domain-containing protein [Ditylenchus destructor]